MLPDHLKFYEYFKIWSVPLLFNITIKNINHCLSNSDKDDYGMFSCKKVDIKEPFLDKAEFSWHLNTSVHQMLICLFQA